MTTFSTRTVPWSKIGTVIEDPHVDAATATRLGGMDFDVRLELVGFRSADGEWRAVPNRRAVVADDETQEVFDVVSKDYQPVQWSEAFRFMDKISDARFVAAGTLRERRQGFIVVEVPGLSTLDVSVRGQSDPHTAYAVLRTSHDRSRGLEVALMHLRHRCMNSLTLSTFTRGVPQRWAIRHVGDVDEKMLAAGRVIDGMRSYSEEYIKIATHLAEMDLLLEDAEIVLKKALPDRPRRDEQVNSITRLWRESNTLTGLHGTGYGLVQAVSEYFEWGRTSGSQTPQSRFLGVLDGETHKQVNRTTQLLRQRIW